MDRDFNLGGRDFKLSKIDPFKQLHIVRRIAPMMGDLVPAFQKVGGLKGEASQEKQLEMIGQFLTPLLTGFSKMTDEDTETVLLGLLSAVEMKQQAGNWAKIANGKLLMIQDLELGTMVNLAARAFMFNLSSFTSAFPVNS